MSSKSGNKFFAYAGLAIAGISLNACGTASSVSPVNYAQAPGNYIPANQIPASAQALFGVYVTTITAIDPTSNQQLGSQQATITLSEGTVTGYSGVYINMTLQSSGSTFGNISFSSLMNVLGPSYNGDAIWDLDSRMAAIQNLSTPPVAPFNDPVDIQLILGVNSANQFDPSSSSIIIDDDGLTQSPGSGTPFQYAVFGTLAKQS